MNAYVEQQQLTIMEDHVLVLQTISHADGPTNNLTWRWSYKQFDTDKFVNNMIEQLRDVVDVFGDINDSHDTWQNMLNEVIDFMDILGLIFNSYYPDMGEWAEGQAYASTGHRLRDA